MTSHEAGGVPSRAVLESAERENDALGHDLGGFLSAGAGFMPKLPTVLAFPPTHEAWDGIVSRMPELWRTVAVRRALDELPVLDADGACLPDGYVWRASCALGIFAHSYVRVEKLDGRPPPSVLLPWAQICKRLGRQRAFLTYNDLIVYNHRLLDPTRGHTVENMELLVPTVDNAEERRFYLVQVEILARGTPVVAAVVRAQEAAVRGDDEALENELLLMTETWQDIIELSLRKADPNPLSATYIDQVVWANTVAPLAVPIDEGTLGPAGAASPVFQLMDAFLGRRFHDSRLGKEVVAMRELLPVHQLRFLRAVDQVSVRDHIAARGGRRLQTVWDGLLDAYGGEKGYLGAHRLKVYGFLELAFKVGRSVTITHIEGAFKDRSWKEADAILEETRAERFKELPPRAQFVRLRAREAASADGGVRRIVLDADETGVVYRAGDRCGVLTTNRPAAAAAALRVLGATGDEPIPLNARWRRALRYWPDYPVGTTTVPLRVFLAHAKLRPLTRRGAKELLAISGSQGLHDVLEAYKESELELADALQLLADEGYDVPRLVDAPLEQREALARIVEPDDFRMYSVASAPDGGDGGVSRTLELTVAQLRYRDEAGRELLGAASTFLAEGPGEEFPIQLVRPSRFALPRDRSRPVVMFAGGVGLAPFRGFVAERSRDGSTGENWMFLSTRSRRELYCLDELAAAVECGKLALRVCFSREKGALVGRSGQPIIDTDGEAGRIDQAIARDPETQATLWRLLGDGAYVYVCGRAGFAQSVIGALTSVAERFLGDAEEARVAVWQLVADGRFMQDVFTSWTPHAAPGVLGGGVFDTSEVAAHRTAETGQWLIVNGAVYDMTEFLHLHPGGPRIIAENVGLDATREYEAVLHHRNSEIEAMLAMYKIGSIRRLDFGREWGIALVPKVGLKSVSLHDLFRNWVRFMHLLTEMSNALDNDWGYLSRVVTREKDPDELNALKVQFASNTHERFLRTYYEAAIGDDLLDLWALTRGLCAPPGFARSLHAAITEAEASPAADLVRRFSDDFMTAYREVSGDPEAVDESQWRSFRDLIAVVRRLDTAFLGEAREIVRSGVIVFEELEARTIADGGERLIATLDRVPQLVRGWHGEFAAALDALGRLPATASPGSV